MPFLASSSPLGSYPAGQSWTPDIRHESLRMLIQSDIQQHKPLSNPIPSNR